MPDVMTPRERWLAAVRMRPVDRFPFWPKISASYARAQAAPFREWGAEAIHDWIGSDKHIGLPGCVREVHRDCSYDTARANGKQSGVYRTPYGEMTEARAFDEMSQSWHPIRFPVQDAEDVKRMTAYFEGLSIELDEESLAEARQRSKETGEDAVTCVSIGESPLMYWVEWLAGVENAHYLLADHEEEVGRLFAAMHEVLLRKTELTAENHPADLLYFFENTSTTLISPEQHSVYCFKHIRDYAKITAAADRNLVLHMCGCLKAILPVLSEIQAQAFEAFTSPPVGDTTLLDGRAHCPGTCLIGGTNATLWLRSAGEIISQIGQHLSQLPHHRGIVVTSAGVMPPLCPPEVIREVRQWVAARPPKA